MLIQSLKPEVDATQLLTQVGIIPTSPPTGDSQSSVICSEGTKTADDSEKVVRTRTGAAVVQREGVEHQLLDIGKHTEEPTVQPDEVLQIVRLIYTEVEPNSKAEVQENVTANLTTGNSETTEMDMRTDGDAELNSIERVRGTTDEAPGSRDETTRVGAATVWTYQRMPAREESSGRKSAEEQSRRTSGERVREDVHSAVGPPFRRRRVLIDEEPEEDDDVIFTLIEALPSSGQTNPPAIEDDIERERNERKRKGKAIATPSRKKPRQAPTTLVIQEERAKI